MLVPGAGDAQKHFEDVELAYAHALRPLTVSGETETSQLEAYLQTLNTVALFRWPTTRQ